MSTGNRRPTRFDDRTDPPSRGWLSDAVAWVAAAVWMAALWVREKAGGK